MPGLGERERRDRPDVRGVDGCDRDGSERPRTTSPDASCGIHCSALAMNELGWSIVHSRPESRTIRSDSMWYLATALVSSPLGTELDESSTARVAPSARSASSSRSVPL